MTRGDSRSLDTTKLTAAIGSSSLCGGLRYWPRGDSGYLDTTKLTASLLLLGPLPSVVVEGSDPG